MKLISFDVGIKNMAYCIFDIVPGSSITISSWDVLNLMDEVITENNICNQCLQSKTKKKGTVENIILCGKRAKYKKGEDKYFCDKHAKMSSFMLPTKECSTSSLKKMKIGDLVLLCHRHLLMTNDHNIPIVNMNKKDVLETAIQFFEKKSLVPIKNVKNKTADETDLITIGRNMKTLLDKIPDLENITHIIIENQISPIANRMKTIQGMLAEYFIIKGSPTLIIEFVSSMNKLKGFNVSGEGENPVHHIVNEGKTGATDKDKYKQHKKDSIIICSRFLNNNENLTKWKDVMTTTKKDDLADSMLQGIWYLKNKHKIEYNGQYLISNVN